MMDGMERYDPEPGTEAYRILRRAQARGIDAQALRPKADAEGRRRTTVLFSPAADKADRVSPEARGRGERPRPSRFTRTAPSTEEILEIFRRGGVEAREMTDEEMEELGARATFFPLADAPAGDGRGRPR